MLPILGVIALGIVVVGIRILWMPSAPKHAITAQPHAARPRGGTRDGAAEKSAAVKTDDEAVTRKEPLSDVVIAQPVQTPEKKATSQKEAETGERRESPQKRVQTERPQQRPPSRPQTERNAPPPAVETPEEKPAFYTGSIEKSAFVVQCGSFSTRASADRSVASLKKTGCNPVVRKAEVNGKTVFRVIVAGGNDRATADEVARLIKKAGHPVFVRPND